MTAILALIALDPFGLTLLFFAGYGFLLSAIESGNDRCGGKA